MNWKWNVFIPLRITKKNYTRLNQEYEFATFAGVRGQLLKENKIVKHIQNKNSTSLYMKKIIYHVLRGASFLNCCL